MINQPRLLLVNKTATIAQGATASSAAVLLTTEQVLGHDLEHYLQSVKLTCDRTTGDEDARVEFSLDGTIWFARTNQVDGDEADKTVFVAGAKGPMFLGSTAGTTIYFRVVSAAAVAALNTYTVNAVVVAKNPRVPGLKHPVRPSLRVVSAASISPGYIRVANGGTASSAVKILENGVTDGGIPNVKLAGVMLANPSGTTVNAILDLSYDGGTTWATSFATIAHATVDRRLLDALTGAPIDLGRVEGQTLHVRIRTASAANQNSDYVPVFTFILEDNYVRV